MPSSYTYDPSNDAGKVRLLLNDVADPWVLTDQEVAAFLSMEGGHVKRAAASAIDANALNEALASKVITTESISTNGAALASAMHTIAEALRAQSSYDDQVSAGTPLYSFPDPAAKIDITVPGWL